VCPAAAAAAAGCCALLDHACVVLCLPAVPLCEPRVRVHCTACDVCSETQGRGCQGWGGVGLGAGWRGPGRPPLCPPGGARAAGCGAGRGAGALPVAPSPPQHRGHIN
jgi:hypothetical protein